VIGRTLLRTSLAGMLLLVAAAAPARGAEEAGGATLTLVVRHALDAGRLVVRVGETAFFSTPLGTLGAASGGEMRRLLSIPAGLQTVSVELRDPRGRIVARREVRSLLVPGSDAVLDVVATAARDPLSLDLRTGP
jgi:hypothetical protein